MPKISELPAGTAPTGAEKFPAVQGASTARFTLTQVYAATKTLTNTTFDTAATGNAFSINGLAATTNTGTGSVVRATSPTLVTPALGTPSTVTLTNGTGLPIASGVANLGAGIATFLTTPSSANLLAALTDETGTGSAVFATSPALVTPNLGTPSAAVLTNATGLPLAGLVAQAAYTVVANATGSSTVPTAVSIPALTQKATPVAADKVMIADSAASDALKYATLTSIVNNIQPTLTKASNVLGADVLLNNTSNYFDGPSMAQGTTGTWFASGTVTVSDSSATLCNIHVKLWDGTSVISSASITTEDGSPGARTTVSLSGYITSPAANIRISARDITQTTGKILFNQSGNSADSSIFGFRIA